MNHPDSSSSIDNQRELEKMHNSANIHDQVVKTYYQENIAPQVPEEEKFDRRSSIKAFSGAVFTLLLSVAARCQNPFERIDQDASSSFRFSHYHLWMCAKASLQCQEQHKNPYKMLQTGTLTKIFAPYQALEQQILSEAKAETKQSETRAETKAESSSSSVSSMAHAT